MTTSVKNVVAGSPRPNGAIFRAPLGTVLPTDATTALPSEFISQGYASDEGLVRAINKAYETIRAWGQDEVKRPRTEIGVEFTFTLIESANGEVAKTIWGEDAVTITPAASAAGTQIAVAYEGDDPEPSVWAFDLKDGNHIRRIALGNAQITTEDFEQTFADAEVIAYQVRLTLFKDESGKYFYEYSDDGVFSA